MSVDMSVLGLKVLGRRRPIGSLVRWAARLVGVWLVVGTMGPRAAAQEPAAAEPGSVGGEAASERSIGSSDPEPFLRIVDGPGTVTLESAVRTMRRADGTGPTIEIASAVHIGERSFYEALQARLDALDLVLFEGVKPIGAGRVELEGEMTETERGEFTERRLRFIAQAVATHRQARGELPKQLVDLAGGLDPRIGRLVGRSLADGWGRPILYNHSTALGTFEVRSAGPDGRSGEERAMFDDLAVAHDDPGVEPMELDTQGIQSQLARALGLTFQLDVMNETGENWRNSDLSVDQVMARMDEAGVEGFTLMDTLSGRSLSSRLAGVLLRMIGLSSTMRELTKLMLVEVLGQADLLLGAMPGDMGKLMGVILHERNEVLLADIVRVIEHEPDVQRLGIIYGGGHLAAVQQRLEMEHGYEHVEDAWVPAIVVDLKKAGVGPAELERTRSMLKRAIEQQVRTMERQAERERAREQRRRAPSGESGEER